MNQSNRTDKPSTKTSAAEVAARGTLISIILRIASFLLSQLTVRFVSASALGKASIPLELLLGTSLFVGREGFRLALTKEVSEHNSTVNDDVGDREYDENERNKNQSNMKQKQGMHTRQKIVNVSWLSIPTGAVLSIAALIMHLHSCKYLSLPKTDAATSDDLARLNAFDYKIAGMLFCLASFIESLAEPLIIRCLQEMDVATKAKAEGVALLCKAASCFGVLYITATFWFQNLVVDFMHPTTIDYGLDLKMKGDRDASNNNFAVTAFGVSQLVYAMVYTAIIYWRGMLAVGGIRWPKRIQAPIHNPYQNSSKSRIVSSVFQNLDMKTLRLVIIFTLQGILKHGLTEADKIVLSALAGSYDQGVYALAASYGGLAARVLLQPIEENARLLFSRQGALVAQHLETMPSDSVEQKTIKKTTNGEGNNTCTEKSSLASTHVKEMEDSYCFLLRAVLYIGLLFASIASNYTSILLRILAGARWGLNAEASATLSAFCVYTAFLAINGTTEAFAYGVARSGKDVGALGVIHALIGGVFATLAPPLVRLRGAVGLVLTNCICMALRSMYSLFYASRYFSVTGKLNKALSGILTSRMMLHIFPHPFVLVLFFSSYLVTRASNNHFYNDHTATGANWMLHALRHISVGVLCVIIVMSAALRFDKELQLTLLRLAKNKSS